MLRRLLTAATAAACFVAMPAFAQAPAPPSQSPASAPAKGQTPAAKPPAATSAQPAAAPAKPAAPTQQHAYLGHRHYRYYGYYGLFGYSRPYLPSYRPYYPPGDVRRRGGPGPRVGSGTGLGIGAER
jgi:hypothetical protein